MDPLDDPVYKAIYDNLSESQKKAYDFMVSNEAKKVFLDSIKEVIDSSSSTGTKIPTYPGGTGLTNESMTQSAIGNIGTRLISKETGNPVSGSYKGYTVQQQVEVPGFVRGGYRAVEPKYFDGDEKLITTLSREDLATLQTKMSKVGLLGKKYRIGVIDSTTINAFSDLLAEANVMGVDFKTAISTLEANPQLGQGTGLKARVDNPDDLKRIIKRASQAVLGYSVPEDRVMNLVRAYQQEQIKAQTGGTNVNMPTAEAFTEARLEEEMPADAQAYKFAQFAQQFLES